MVDLVTALLRTAESMDRHGGYPRSASLMRDAAEEIADLRKINAELTRRWNGLSKRKARVASGIVAATAGETEGLDERSEQSPVGNAETPKS